MWDLFHSDNGKAQDEARGADTVQKRPLTTLAAGELRSFSPIQVHQPPDRDSKTQYQHYSGGFGDGKRFWTDGFKRGHTGSFRRGWFKTATK